MQHKDFCLEVLNGKSKGQTFLLSADRITIGRKLAPKERKRDWILLEDSSLARIHAILTWDDEKTLFTITRKADGKIFKVNDQKVDSALLYHLDLFQLGDIRFRIWDGPVDRASLEGESEEVSAPTVIYKEPEPAPVIHTPKVEPPPPVEPEPIQQAHSQAIRPGKLLGSTESSSIKEFSFFSDRPKSTPPPEPTPVVESDNFVPLNLLSKPASQPKEKLPQDGFKPLNIVQFYEPESGLLKHKESNLNEKLQEYVPEPEPQEVVKEEPPVFKPAPRIASRIDNFAFSSKKEIEEPIDEEPLKKTPVKVWRTELPAIGFSSSVMLNPFKNELEQPEPEPPEPQEDPDKKYEELTEKLATSFNSTEITPEKEEKSDNFQYTPPSKELFMGASAKEEKPLPPVSEPTSDAPDLALSFNTDVDLAKEGEEGFFPDFDSVDPDQPAKRSVAYISSNFMHDIISDDGKGHAEKKEEPKSDSPEPPVPKTESTSESLSEKPVDAPELPKSESLKGLFSARNGNQYKVNMGRTLLSHPASAKQVQPTGLFSTTKKEVKEAIPEPPLESISNINSLHVQVDVDESHSEIDPNNFKNSSSELRKTIMDSDPSFEQFSDTNIDIAQYADPAAFLKNLQDSAVPKEPEPIPNNLIPAFEQFSELDENYDPFSQNFFNEDSNNPSTYIKDAIYTSDFYLRTRRMPAPRHRQKKLAKIQLPETSKEQKPTKQDEEQTKKAANPKLEKKLQSHQQTQPQPSQQVRQAQAKLQAQAQQAQMQPSQSPKSQVPQQVQPQIQSARQQARQRDPYKNLPQFGVRQPQQPQQAQMQPAQAQPSQSPKSQVPQQVQPQIQSARQQAPADPYKNLPQFGVRQPQQPQQAQMQPAQAQPSQSPMPQVPQQVQPQIQSARQRDPYKNLPQFGVRQPQQPQQAQMQPAQAQPSQSPKSQVPKQVQPQIQSARQQAPADPYKNLPQFGVRQPQQPQQPQMPPTQAQIPQPQIQPARQSVPADPYRNLPQFSSTPSSGNLKREPYRNLPQFATTPSGNLHQPQSDQYNKLPSLEPANQQPVKSEDPYKNLPSFGHSTSSGRLQVPQQPAPQGQPQIQPARSPLSKDPYKNLPSLGVPSGKLHPSSNIRNNMLSRRGGTETPRPDEYISADGMQQPRKLLHASKEPIPNPEPVVPLADELSFDDPIYNTPFSSAPSFAELSKIGKDEEPAEPLRQSQGRYQVNDRFATRTLSPSYVKHKESVPDGKKWLLNFSANLKRAPFSVENDEIIIGRIKGIDISFDDLQLADRHIKLYQYENKLYLQKLDKHRPVFVNDRPLVSAAGRELFEGDKVQISERIVFYIGKENV